jgi:hypothetical protein
VIGIAIVTPRKTFFFLFAPIWELAPLLEHRADFSVSCSFKDGRTSWTGDQLVARLKRNTFRILIGKSEGKTPVGEIKA